MIGGIVLAAGAGRRFGGPKQLAPLHGRPLIEHAVAAMTAVPAIDPIVVVLGAHAERIQAEADLYGVDVLVCAGWAEGQAASLRAGVKALEACDAVVVTLADQPFVSPQVIAGVLDRADARAAAVRATYAGRPGHPVLLKRSLYARIAALEGDVGARDLLATVRVQEWECGHLSRGEDIDTPEQLEAFRA